MNTSDYRNKQRKEMTNSERNKESYQFSEYMKNGKVSDAAMKFFKRKPYHVG